MLFIGGSKGDIYGLGVKSNTPDQKKTYLSLTRLAKYARFMWELSKLVIWPLQLFSAQSSDFTQQVELFAIRAVTTEKTLCRQTKTFFTVFLSLPHTIWRAR